MYESIKSPRESSFILIFQDMPVLQHHRQEGEKQFDIAVNFKPLHGVVVTNLLARLDETNTSSISLVYNIDFTIIFVAEHVKVVINIVEGKHRLLNSDWV